MDHEEIISVQYVSDEGLCNGCGTCVAACPSGCISIDESVTGLLLAEVDSKNCTLCGICTQVCSAVKVSPDLIDPLADHFSGNPLTAFCGYSNDIKLKENGQSGGVATSLVSYMLDSKSARYALMTGPGKEGVLRPGPVIIDSTGQVMSSQSSKYCPVALNTELRRIDDFDKLVYIGLSCHIRGLHNYLKTTGGKKGRPLIIGLFCDSVLSFKAADYLISASGSEINESDISGFRYKDKRYGTFPGDCTIDLYNGNRYQVPDCKRVFVKGLLKPPYCFLCHDKLNMYSDISLGDSWGLNISSQGSNAVLCWTERGRLVLNSAINAGYINIEPVGVSPIIKGQGIPRRKISWRASMAIWNKTGRHVPVYGPPVPGEYLRGGEYKKATKAFLRSLQLFSAQSLKEFNDKFDELVRKNYQKFRVKTFLISFFMWLKKILFYNKKV
jgi:coenzyme F420 hydrogenase subunit beta